MMLSRIFQSRRMITTVARENWRLKSEAVQTNKYNSGIR